MLETKKYSVSHFIVIFKTRYMNCRSFLNSKYTTMSNKSFEGKYSNDL